jgi:hypothetical protein
VSRLLSVAFEEQKHRIVMTIDELTAAVMEVAETDAWPALVGRLQRLGDGPQFRLLFPLATAAQWDCPLAYSAALLLDQVRPACPLPCEEALRGLLGGWDVSIEEVPWYLAAAFGRARVLETVATLLREPLSDPEVSQLRAVAYWLGVNEPQWVALQSRGCGDLVE